jgi:2-amino-4-hydroxy-6-hydroxymethyldihydropteridine diphosphokinase
VTRAFVGLGANLGDREGLIARALELLDAEPQIHVVGVSSLRETAPWGLVEQPDFLNGAAEVETTLRARSVLDVLLAIEGTLGRTRGAERYGPRTIDLDLLLYGDEIRDEPGLAVPHPRLHERTFALEPLQELDPDLVVPGKGRVADLLAALHSAP